MPEQTELKRTRQHVGSLWSLINGPGYALKCKCGQWEARGKHESRLREQHRAHRVEMGEWVKPRKEGPDWADLREMARNAGWGGHADEPYVRIWGANGTDRMSLDWDAGSVRVFRHGLVVDLAGPSATYAHEAVHLINPTPARVLAAARLLGLGGTS